MYGAVLLLFPALCLGSRCLQHHQPGHNEAVVHTPAGDVLGLTQTQIDPRRKKTVTWTSYFVSSSRRILI